ncbi:MAG: adenylate/guanylate cyclase domain-containing protein [Pseudomonadota bacterium]
MSLRLRLKILRDILTGSHLPEGQHEPSFEFSKYSLSFRDPGIEREYRDYRNAVVARSLPWLLGIIAGLVMLGGVVDFLVFGGVAGSAGLLATRAAVDAIMLAGLILLIRGYRPRKLQYWIAAGLVVVHGLWLLSTPLMAQNFVQYLGVLPVNILLTFIVSGLMFRHARWIGGAAALAYAWVILAFYPGPPWGPLFYLMVLSFYAAYAAYVAERARREAWVEKEAYERLLKNVLPPVIATRMQEGERLIADSHEDACVLFADIVGFTAMSERMSPRDLVDLLNEIFTRFDEITDAFDLEKIKTIGDCYMVAGGLPVSRRRDPERIALAALKMQQVVAEIGAREGVDLKIRAGVHTGPVVAGVIGQRKFVYDLWGDTVNTASRLESAATPGTVSISAALRDELGPEFSTEFIAEMQLKGKAQGFPVWHLKDHRTGMVQSGG